MEKFRITDLEKPQPSAAMTALLNRMSGAEIVLEADALIALAEAQTAERLDIDDRLVNRFVRLFDEITSNGPTHIVGRYMLQQLAVTGIIQTSRMRCIREKHPEIAEAALSPPLIVAGMPRSGTTYLLQLLATEPGLVSMKRWEAMQPFPSLAQLQGDEEDQREKEGNEHLLLEAELTPLLKFIYDVEPGETTEEVEAMVHGCYGVVLSFIGDIPKYDAAFYDSDQSAAYQYLYQLLQTQSWLKQIKPGEKWLIKSPQHMGALPELNAAFPNAAMIFTHRDPASVFSSLVTFLGYMVRTTYSSISKQQLIDRALRMQHGFLKGIVRNAELFDGRSEHIYFNAFMQDYHNSVEKVFTVAGLEYDTAAQARVEVQANAYKRGRKGRRLVYDIEKDFGLTREAIRNEFSYYLDKFPVEIEEAQA